MTPMAQTARTYALVGFIFYALGAIGWFFGAIFSWMFRMSFSWRESFGHMGSFFPFIFPMGIFAAISIGFAAWSWFTLKNIEAERYAEAQTSSLILGIFGLFPPLAWLIGGIFWLLAYSKLGEIIRGVPPPLAPVGRYCTGCGRPLAADAKFCSYCGKEVPP